MCGCSRICRTLVFDLETSIAGQIQFEVSGKDAAGNDKAYDSNIIFLTYVEPTPEPTQSPELQAAFAAREAFLDAQAVYSGYAVPANVSYAVSELPFAHGSPVAGYTSSGFGYRLHPLENKVKFHYGTDFAANSGTTVCAFADGTVLAAGQSEGYGNYVKLGHADGYATLYGHCSKLLVRAGETVTLGQPIALVGATGKATGPHLHFELMHDGYYYNPEFYLAA